MVVLDPARGGTGVAHTSLLVIGAGPYGVAVGARAVERGIDTVIVGRPMGFWKEHMPEGMFLRSGPDWHLDASGVHTFEAFLEDRGISHVDIDPVPIAVFLDYAAWFQRRKGLTVRDNLVSRLTTRDGRFAALLDDGTEITADTVVAAPGAGYFRQLPQWSPAVPEGIGVHTADLIRFEELRDARVLIVGGRQSAYEWAALLGDHRAGRVDIAHRHDVPRFERVSWKFVDAYVDATLSVPGWWRSLTQAEQEAIARRFWEVGRLTLEWWLTPRLTDDRFQRWPGTHVVEVTSERGNTATVTLSNLERLTVDRIIFATGYRTDLPQVPYLDDVISQISVADGAPVLDAAFQSTLAGLYIPGFAATHAFGPFFGFTKACPAAATLIVDDLLRRP
jgi:cation diffusion facilitator CzcD-associated flavoprotein CzcO